MDKNFILEIELFGPVRVIVAGTPMVPLSCRKCITILALLALNYDQMVDRDWLCQLLWPNAPVGSERRQLQNALDTLRQALGNAKDCIVSEGAFLQLKLAECIYVDVHEFDQLIVDADFEKKIQATNLFKGQLLSSLRVKKVSSDFDTHISYEQNKRNDLYVQALLDVADCLIAQENYTNAIEHLERALRVQPRNEAVFRRLMSISAERGNARDLAVVLNRLRKAINSDPDGNDVPSQETMRIYKSFQTKLTQAKPLRAISTHMFPCIGRENERSAIRTQLQNSRLITLTGEGGIGKSRLAAQIVDDLQAEFPDGIAHIKYRGTETEQELYRTIASAFNIPEEVFDSLENNVAEGLHNCFSLLLVDGGELSPEPLAAVINLLLRKTLNLKILVTSRVPLKLLEESVFRLSTLPCPPEGEIDLSQISSYSAVQMFMNHLKFRQPKLELSLHNAEAIADICRRLDGWPLALELVARSAENLSVFSIRESLDTHFWKRTGKLQGVQPQYQDLKSSISWSFDCLLPEEKTLLLRLCIFPHSWTIAAASAICADLETQSDETADPLSEGRINNKDVIELVDQLAYVSMLQVEKTSLGEIRYRLLNPLRLFVREKWGSSQEKLDLDKKHTQYFFDFAQDQGEKLNNSELFIWLDAVEQEIVNIRTALEWSLREQNISKILVAKGVQVFRSLWRFYVGRGFLTEARSYLTRLLAYSNTDTLIRARGLNLAAVFAYHQSDYDTADFFHNQSLMLYRELQDSTGIGANLNGLGNIARNRHDNDRAEKLFKESHDLWKYLSELPCPPDNASYHIAVSLNNLGMVAYEQDLFDHAKGLMEESRLIFRRNDDVRMVAEVDLNIAYVECELQQRTTAMELFQKLRHFFDSIGDKRLLALCYAGIADIISVDPNTDVGEDAGALYRVSLVGLESVGNWSGITEVLFNYGSWCCRQDNWSEGLQMIGASERVRTDLKMRLRPAVALREEAARIQGQEHLGASVFEKNISEGRNLKLSEIGKWMRSGLRPVSNN